MPAPDSQLSLLDEPPAPRAEPEAPPSRDALLPQAERLAAELHERLAEPVRLVLNDNTSTMVSFRRREGVLTVRLHHLFTEADEAVVGALAAFIARGGPKAGRVIDAFVKARADRLRATRLRNAPVQLQERGDYHDLGAYLRELNASHFAGAIDARIGWAREAPDRRRRSIRMGSYHHETRVIRLHPALDRPEVPAYFVRYVVFHEMVHQAVPVRRTGTGRRQMHGRDFRRLERTCPDYERALAWERDHLPLLLGRRRARGSFDPDDPLA